MLICQSIIIYQGIHCVNLKIPFCFESTFFNFYLLKKKKKNPCKLYTLTAAMLVKWSMPHHITAYHMHLKCLVCNAEMKEKSSSVERKN